MREYKTFFNVLFFLIGCLVVPLIFVSFAHASCSWVEFGNPVTRLYDMPTCMSSASGQVEPPVSDGQTRSYDTCSRVNDSYGNLTTHYLKAVCTPVDANGKKDNDEDGIDCGGSTGVPCVSNCPYGYTLTSGVCVSNDPVGHKNIPEPAIWDSDRWGAWDGDTDIYNSFIPVLASSSTFVPDSSYQAFKNSFNGGQRYTVSDGDEYVTRSGDGSVVSAKYSSNDPIVDNGDGTSTETIHNYYYDTSTNSNSETVITRIIDNTSNNVLSSNQTSSGSGHSTSPLTGAMSNNGLTGDQFSNGVGLVLDKMDQLGSDDGDDDPAVDVPAFAVEGVDFDGTLSPDDIPEKLSIPDTISDFVANSPLFILLNSLKVDISDPQCKFTVDGLSFFGKSMSLDFDMCRWQDFLQSLGAFMLMFTQALAVIVIFRGLK